MHDKKLSFGNYIDSVCNKVYRSVAVINKLATFIPKNSLRCLHFSLVYPHVIYSAEVCCKTNSTKLRRVRSLLGKCLKILNNSRTDNPYFKINPVIFDQVYEYFSLIRIYKYYVPGIGSYFKEKFCDNRHHILILLDLLETKILSIL